MMTTIEIIGRSILETFLSLRALCGSPLRSSSVCSNPRTYNSASRMVFINQFYFTSVQILPLFLFVAVIFGSLVNGMAFQVLKDLGLHDYLGRLLMGFVVTEVAPFVTVLLIALRSSSAINAEIAVMKVNRELNTLDIFNIDLIDYLFVPRILNGMLSMVLLSSLFSLVILASRAFCFQRGFRHKRRCLYRHPAAIRLFAGYRHRPVQVRHIRVFHYADPDPPGSDMHRGS